MNKKEMRILEEINSFRLGIKKGESSYLMNYILSRKEVISPPTLGEVEKRGIKNKVGITR